MSTSQLNRSWLVDMSASGADADVTPVECDLFDIFATPHQVNIKHYECCERHSFTLRFFFASSCFAYKHASIDIQRNMPLPRVRHSADSQTGVHLYPHMARVFCCSPIASDNSAAMSKVCILQIRGGSSTSAVRGTENRQVYRRLPSEYISNNKETPD